MTAPLATSRVFDAARKMKTRLSEPTTTWTAHPETGEKPAVGLADIEPTQNAELIVIEPDIGDDDATIQWANTGHGRDEEFNIDVVILVGTGLTEDQLLDRLEELADIVQRALYDERIPQVTPLDIAQAVLLEGVGQVAWQILTSPDGFEGRARIRYRLRFRI